MPAGSLKRAVVFIVTVIAATWVVHWLGSGPAAAAGPPGIPVGMFVPALVAIIFRVFFFTDSSIHHRRLDSPVRLLLFSYIGVFALCLILEFVASRSASERSTLVGIGGVLMTLWTLLFIRLYSRNGEGVFGRHGLGLGKIGTGQLFVVGYALFFLTQFGLNLLLSLGEFRGVQPLPGNVSLPGFAYPIALLVLFLFAVIGTPLASMAVMFGEEYGWRGFLQDELQGLGHRRGALIIGVVWWFWHFPIILSGIHTYPPSTLGFSMALLFFVLWGFVQSYAVLKTGSIWAAAFLHGVVNSVYSFGLTYLVRPENKLMAFGLGWPGLACLALVVVIILRDPVWSKISPASAPSSPVS